MLLKFQAAAFVLIFSAAGAAQADVTISSDVTNDMRCAAGVCQPMASDAVLNVGDLEYLLTFGNLIVTTTGSGIQANNIRVTSGFRWSFDRLTLDAYHSVSIAAPVTVKGDTGLSIITNDGGSGGELAFFEKGHVTFKKLSGQLSINGASYKLVNSISSLASAVQKTPSGKFALASSYDASKDGIYANAPIATGFMGSFDGLGNEVSNLNVDISNGGSLGLFAGAYQGSSIGNIGVVNATMVMENYKGQSGQAGILIGGSGGTILRSYASGTITTPKDVMTGGLVGIASIITECHSSARVRYARGSNSAAGGLVGYARNSISMSYATGDVESGNGFYSTSGGLAGVSIGAVSNSYATGKVTGYADGGLTGANAGMISSSYSTGKVKGFALEGGLIGDDGSAPGSLSDTYWDMNTSGITNSSQGAGSPANDPGIIGLTTEQLQSGLPDGFDPAVWGENADINNGLPYLLANPPK